MSTKQPGSTTKGEYGESQYGPRLDYSEKRWRDPIFAILWIIHMFVMIYLLYSIWTSSNVDVSVANEAFLVIFVVAVVGGLFGVIWLQILRSCAETIIKMMLILNLILLILAAGMAVLSGGIYYAIIMVIFVIIFALYVRAVWHRIPFAAALINIAGKIIQIYSGTIWVSILSLILQFIWVLWWAAITTGYFSQSNTSNLVIFGLLVSFYWNLQVFQNISHFTTCGVTGAWYFNPNPNDGVTSSALIRACTTSLGSICLGSLLVAIIQAVRAMLRAARQSAGSCGQIAYCLIDCLLGCLERLIRWFNKYAYVQCALYGTSFKESASRTWELLKSRGIDLWINDDLTGFALLCGCIVGGIVCALVGYFMADYTGDFSYTELVVIAIISFLVGFCLCRTVLYTISSGVAALFVCYAEDPDAMSQNRPEDYNLLTSKAPQY